MTKILIERSVVEQVMNWLSTINEPSAVKHVMCLEEILGAALEQPQVEQEPVTEITGMDEYDLMLGWHKPCVEFPVGTKLYTSPQPPSDPLSDEGIMAGLRNAIELATQYEQAAFRKGVKFAESAHGIAVSPRPPSHAPVVEQKPVAWALSHSSGLEFSSNYPMQKSMDAAEQMARKHMGAVTVTPLYMHQQLQREPLTDEQINRILKPLLRTVPYNWKAIVRAIEAAHGIKEQK